MKNKRLAYIMLTALTVLLVASGSAVAAIDGGYVGSTACGVCHTAIKADFDKTGHPWKYKYTGGLAPTDPLSDLFTRPSSTNDGTWINTVGNQALLVDDGSGKLDWSAINYTVGGFGWKIRWGVRDSSVDFASGKTASNDTGYVWSGPKTQNNLEATDSWSAYPSTTPTDKKYSCAICHNTNGTSSDDTGCKTDLGTAVGGRTEPWLANTDLGMSPSDSGGYFSEWTFDGIQCEACHGPGEGHGEAGTISVRKIDTNADGVGDVEICAQCHVRSKATIGLGGECGVEDKFSGTLAILTNGAPMGKDAAVSQTYVGHHEQYNEMHGLNEDGVHASLSCTTCHDPHKRAAGVVAAVATALSITDPSGPAGGAIKVACTDCHYGKTSVRTAAYDLGDLYTVDSHAGVACIDCHMAEATKTATAATGGTWGAKGDLKTHIFKISPTLNAASSTPTDTVSFFNRDNGAGKYVAQNAIPVRFACGKCHDSGLSSYAGAGSPTALTEADAKTAAASYHAPLAVVDTNYVGSNVCGTCHVQKYDDFVQTGHPYKVRFTKGETPYDDTSCTPGEITGSGICDPLSNLLTGLTPSMTNINTLSMNGLAVDDGSGRLDWSAVEYVIGGYGWKARWAVRDTINTAETTSTGYVWSGTTQYNMLFDNYVGYNGGKDKKYSCAICHNTNGTSSIDATCTTDLGSGRSEPWASTGMTYTSPGGFRSEWTLSGVQCEACHGPGQDHATAASTSNIVKNNSKDVCGKCHIRAENTAGVGAECGGDASALILSGGAIAGTFISHHEQYNEMVGVNSDGVHASLNCVDCHDPHKRSHKVTDAIAGALGITDNADTAVERGAVVSCESCHGAMPTKMKMGSTTCIDCHMAEATKSADASSTAGWGRKADVKTHIFKIDPTQGAITRTNGATWGNKTVATNYITPRYACGKCHDSVMGLASGVTTTFDETGAQSNAAGMHSRSAFNHSTSALPIPTNGSICDNCHPNLGDGTSGYSIASIVPKCATCHGIGDVGPYKTTAILTAMAKDMHLSNVGPVIGKGTVTKTGYTVSFTDASTDADGTADLKVTVNWGDGTVKTQDAGTLFSNTYTRARTYKIYHSVTDGSLSDTETWSESVPTKTDVTVTIAGATVTKKVSALLKLNGHTKKVARRTGIGDVTFKNVRPGDYTIKVYSYGNTFPVDTEVTVNDDGTFTPASITITAD